MNAKFIQSAVQKLHKLSDVKVSEIINQVS